MATQPTNLPVPSESPRDLKFNAGKIDEFVTSRELKYIDRFGGEHYTIEGISKLSKEAISSFGYITMDSFEDGNTLTLPNQVLRLEATGEYYRWDGAFPKVVPAASTPESTGGIGIGKWLSVGDATLRGELSSKDGYSLVGELKSVADFYGMTGDTGKKVHLKGWYSGNTSGSGEFYFDSAIPKSKHDGGKYISPTVPYTTAKDFVSGLGETNPAGSGVWVRSDVVSELRGEWYGMISGIDVTVMSQKMADTAGVEGYGLVWPAGSLLLSGTVTVKCDNSANGQVKFLRGHSKRGTIFIIDVITTPSVIGMLLYGSIGTANQTQDMVVIEGFSFLGNGATPSLTDKTGTGLYIQNVNGLRMVDVDCKNLDRGCIIQNSLYIYIGSSRFESSQTGMLCRRNGLVTGANAVEIVNCAFTDNILYGLQCIESHAFRLSNCAFEGNGRTTFHGAPSTGVAAVQFSEGGVAGGNIAVFDTCDFEANLMPDIKYLSSTNRVQMVTVRNTVFSNTRDNVTSPHVMLQTTSTGLSTGKYILEMQGNTFYNGKPDEPTPRTNVIINGFASLGYGHASFLDYDNSFYGAINIEKIVAYKKSPDDGFICRGLSAGGFTASASRNVISCTRQGTGVYRVITNQLTTSFSFSIQLDNSGFATFSASENNEALTVSIFDANGAPADRSFRMIGKLI
ncbi:tailspike protein [Hafnia phage Pocitis76]|nr:tailspike protein [Hafnia phage Pocitis76]